MSEDKTKLRAQIARGDEAARAYGSPLVKEFFTKTKEHVRREWENSHPGDGPAREHQWRLFQALAVLEECFTTTIQSGKFAEQTLVEAAKAEKPGAVTRAIRRVV